MAQLKSEKQLIVERKEVLETQKALLGEKLNIHLDFWTADKWLLEKDLCEARRAQASKEAYQAQEIAELNLSLGLQQQENFLLNLKLEKALDDIEDLQANFGILQLQLHEEKKKSLVLEQCAAEQKTYFSTKEAERLNQVSIQLKNYTEQLTAMQKAHEVELKGHEVEIKEEKQKADKLKKTVSELEMLHKEQLLNERQKVQKIEQELAVLQDNQAKEQEKHKQIHELEQQICKLKEKHQREVQKQKGETEKLNSQRKKEVVALVRERDFVWEQFKRMEEEYISRLKVKDEQLQSARTKISNFCSVAEELPSILRMNWERAQEDVHMLKEAMMTKRVKETDCQDLRKVPPKGEERSKDDHYRKNACSDSNTENEFFQQLTSTNRQSPQQKKEVQESVFGDDSSVIYCNPSSDGNEVLEELKDIRRQFEEAVNLLNVKGEELKKASKKLEDLRTENDNLRVLYGVLEVKYNEKQKSDKLSRNTRKDVTTRNLNAELDAAALDVLEFEK
ncbi:hypothetical protein O6H91_19G063600 [Diphasiastrum complanatum]|uniref:Uncharacterized protein n=1 Tax=Diphasiastrum complanatum TaxID=34168 RepID=A0ACC2AVV6_DIPCM|nr:hypothetical protein O6H91_19G063600 [Diphasiastrum complanatum]